MDKVSCSRCILDWWLWGTEPTLDGFPVEEWKNVTTEDWQGHYITRREEGGGRRYLYLNPSPSLVANFYFLVGCGEFSMGAIDEGIYCGPPSSSE